MYTLLRVARRRPLERSWVQPASTVRMFSWGRWLIKICVLILMTFWQKWWIRKIDLFGEAKITSCFSSVFWTRKMGLYLKAIADVVDNFSGLSEMNARENDRWKSHHEIQLPNRSWFRQSILFYCQTNSSTGQEITTLDVGFWHKYLNLVLRTTL